MLHCQFHLNSQPLSQFVAGGSCYSAFSGIGEYVNQPASACLVDQGPIPTGRYYILNRESGGRLGWLYDRFGGRSEWFALYADDGEINDFTTWCEDVVRGQFRLHPRGPSGISQGCIVIDQAADFQTLARNLRNRQPVQVGDTGLNAWGTVTVT